MDGVSIRSSLRPGTYLPKPTIEELEVMIYKRDYERLILSHVGLAGAIAARFSRKYYHKKEELLGVAILTLVECVNRVLNGKSEVDSSYFWPYLHKSIKYGCLDFIKRDHLIRPPINSKWIIDVLKEEGKEALEPYFQYLQYNLEDELEENEDQRQQQHQKIQYFLKDPYDQFIIKDVVNNEMFTSRERFIMNQRLNGYTDQEIADNLIPPISKAQVGNIRKECQRKINILLRNQR